mgnify:CR=1 FL=1
MNSREILLDRLFSLYVRIRDTDYYGNFQCITCGTNKGWYDCTCGHFRKRSHRATRWHPMNAHAQCATCNTLDNYALYEMKMIEMYGRQQVEELVALSRTMPKITSSEIEEKIYKLRKLCHNIQKSEKLKINVP